MDNNILEDARTLELDWDNKTMKINGEVVEDEMLIEVPGPDGWRRAQLFNLKSERGAGQQPISTIRIIQGETGEADTALAKRVNALEGELQNIKNTLEQPFVIDAEAIERCTQKAIRGINARLQRSTGS